MSAQKYTKCSLSNVSRFDNRHFQRRFYPDDAHKNNGRHFRAYHYFIPLRPSAETAGQTTSDTAASTTWSP